MSQLDAPSDVQVSRDPTPHGIPQTAPTTKHLNGPPLKKSFESMSATETTGPIKEANEGHPRFQIFRTPGNARRLDDQGPDSSSTAQSHTVTIMARTAERPGRGSVDRPRAEEGIGQNEVDLHEHEAIGSLFFLSSAAEWTQDLASSAQGFASLV